MYDLNFSLTRCTETTFYEGICQLAGSLEKLTSRLLVATPERHVATGFLINTILPGRGNSDLYRLLEATFNIHRQALLV